MIRQNRKFVSGCSFYRDGSWIRPAALVLVFFSVIILPSCNKEKSQAPLAEKYEIDKKYERGPVTLHVKVNRKEITIADRITLRLEVTADENYTVDLPKFGEKLEQFGIVDYDNPPAKLAGTGRVLYQRSYELEPFLSGDYKIPPLKITFWKKDEKTPKKHDLESEETLVRVKSLLPEKTGQLKIKGLVPPLELPGSDRKWLYLAAGIGAAGLVLGGGIVLRRRRKKVEIAMSKIPAHELAYRELERLLAEQLIERGEIKLFYIRISDILRHYIENRFALHAPERTTEEFLAEIHQSETLAGRYQALLKEFLVHCDMVKFAELRPTNDEIQKTFDICKQFVLETQVNEAEVAAAPVNSRRDQNNEI
jgi:hypothetical protein